MSIENALYLAEVIICIVAFQVVRFRQRKPAGNQ